MILIWVNRIRKNRIDWVGQDIGRYGWGSRSFSLDWDREERKIMKIGLLARSFMLSLLLSLSVIASADIPIIIVLWDVVGIIVRYVRIVYIEICGRGSTKSLSSTRNLILRRARAQWNIIYSNIEINI